MCHFQIRGDWSLFFWGQWANRDGQCSTLCFHVREFFRTSIGTTGRGNRSGRHLVSTGWGYSPYFSNFDDETATDVPWAPRLSEGWCAVASVLTWFAHLRLLPVGSPERESLSTSASHLGRTQESNSRGNRRYTHRDVPKCGRKLQKSSSSIYRGGGHHLSDLVFKTS